MISLNDYLKGRDVEYAADFTEEIKANAIRTIQCVNAGLELFYHFPIKPNPTRRTCNSGWRPAALNAAAGGALHSHHMTALACDISDDDEQELALWSLRNKDMLINVGIVAMERPEACVKLVNGKIVHWVHWQVISVASGVFVFWPSQSAYADWAKSGKPLMA